MSNIHLNLSQEAHNYFNHPGRNPVKHAELDLETGQLQIVFEDTEAYIDELEGYSIGLICNTLEIHHIWSTAPLGIKTNIHLINLLKKQNPPNLQKNFKIYYETCLRQGIDGDKAEWSWYAAQQANDPYAMIHVQNTSKEAKKG